MNRRSIVRVAHRGASAQFPENTLLAFRRAIEQGVDALEIDIHRTTDDELVVIRDAIVEILAEGNQTMQPQHLKPELIVMLTHYDQTVPDALALFERANEDGIQGRGVSYRLRVIR